MTTSRHNTLDELASLVSEQHLSHPLRLAVDGRTASGKTTLADELATALATLGRSIIRTSIDDFHHPKALRYARGRFSAEGYYLDARDLPAIRALLLEPLGPNGSRWYRTASFDLEKDVPVEQPAILAAEDAILIVDGTFLQRPELAKGWDLSIYVDVSEAEAERRGINRDAQNRGSEQAVRRLYAERYLPAFALYEASCQPKTNADILIDNSDFERPILRYPALIK